MFKIINLEEVFLAIVQAATEFLPISSSGHLALFSNLTSSPNLFFITLLHIASLIAVLAFTRKEIYNLIRFNKEYLSLWKFLIIATIPAALIGFLFESLIEKSLSSFLFLGIGFIITGFVLLGTKFVDNKNKKLNWKNSLIIGLFQVLALFPGFSRSGMTISAGLFLSISREKAAKFSFLLFIPLSLGAMALQIINNLGNFTEEIFSFSIIISFLLCLFLSYLFLNLLYIIIKKGYFWIFSIYCFFIGIVSLILYFV